MKNFWKILRELSMTFLRATVIACLLSSLFFMVIMKGDMINLQLEQEMTRAYIVNLQIEQGITRAYFDKIVSTHYKMLEKIIESNKNLIKQDKKLLELDIRFAKDISNLYEAQKDTFKILTKFPKIIEENLSDHFLPPNYEKLSQANYLLYNIDVEAHGSGTLIKIKNEFYILTCAHLLDKETDFIFAENTITHDKYPIMLVKIDKLNDLALFKINIQNFKKQNEIVYLKISDKIPNVGDEIYVIGNPGYHDDILTSGIIAKKEKTHYLITALIYFGNSGGAVIYNGKIVGVIRSIDTQFKLDYIPIGEEAWWLEAPYAYPVSVSYGVAINLEIINNFLEDIK